MQAKTRDTQLLLFSLLIYVPDECLFTAYSLVPQKLEFELVLFWRGKESWGCFLAARLKTVFETLLIIYFKPAWGGDLQFSSVAPLLVAASADQEKRIRWCGDKITLLCLL